MNSTYPPKPWLIEFILLAAIWGSSFLFTRQGAIEFGVLPTARVRVAIAALFLLPLLLWRGLGLQLVQHWKRYFSWACSTRPFPSRAIPSRCCSSAPGCPPVLNATVSLFGALVAWIWLKDRPHGLRILGLVIGFLGVALLAWDKASFKPDATGSQAGATLGLALPTLWLWPQRMPGITA